MADLYRDYFNIDPEFYHAVNADIIAKHPDLWEKFYPHETFVKLLRDVISCVNRQQKLSVWVEGEYGTGKSHAVLTLKNLLEASDDKSEAYFKRFPDQLDHDLYNKLYSLKHAGKILTVHRYASSDVMAEADLLFDVQDSIVAALRKNGYSEGDGALRSAALAWLNDVANKSYFNALMQNAYAAVFGGDNVDTLIQKLNSYTGLPLSQLMGKVMKVARERGIQVLSLTKEVVQNWIRSVIEENNLYAIVFIWDEFTDFFRNNRMHMSGFQALVEMSAVDHFYMIPVTHNVANLFPAKDKEWTIISHRFVLPFCNIELPDNMAFRLMGAALEKTKDPVLRREWEEDSDELYERTREARGLVKKRAKIEDKELKDVLPLHPYAALLLKHMASYYAGDVRSMFDFLKNDTGDEIKGFKWFIDHYGPMDENPLLTVDMLWDFFYEKGKELLDRDVRKTLDSFDRARNMMADEPRVLKAVLLMQAIYEKTGSQVDVLSPSEKNIEYAFMGSDLDAGQPTKIAESLVRKKILYKTPGTNLYNALLNAEEEIPAVEVRFGSLVDEGQLQEVISPRGALRLRYDFTVVTTANFQSKLNMLRNQNADNKIHVVVGFAQNGNDAYDMGKKISEAAQNPGYPFVFIDASLTPLGDDRYDQIADSKSKYEYWLKKDKNMAGQYSKNAADTLKDWKSNVSRGEFMVYHAGAVSGKRLPTLDAVYTELNAIDRATYPFSLESFAQNATDTMWQANQLKNGVGLGAGSGKTLSQFSCVPKDLGEAWTTEKYWEKMPHLTISKIKTFMDGLIAQTFENSDRISIRTIYEALYQAPYGFMVCNQTAFILGFLLKEYVDGSYSFSDSIKSDKLDIEKLQNIVSEYISEKMNPTLRYKDKYIVKMTPEMKAFIAASSEVFNRPVTVSRMEDIRDTLVRPAMHQLPFPMWCLKYALNGMSFKNQKEDVQALIDLYRDFANSGSAGGRTDQDIAGDIGKLCMTHPGLAQDLRQMMNEQKVKEGMRLYLATFDEGILPRLGDEIGDNGQYLNRLQKRFDRTNAANWVWFKETTDQQIRSLILEYKIIAASNRLIQRSSSFSGCIDEWCSICKNIKISYLYAKNYWNDLGPLMEILYNMKRTGQLQENQQENFLQLIEQKGEAFTAFYNHQENVFSNACSYVLHGMDESAIAELYKQLSGSDLFTMEKSSYQQRVTDAVKAWNENQAGSALRKLWMDATNTESPQAWSKKYLMPILCMVDRPEEETAAKQAFDTINAVIKKKMDQYAIDRAAQFLTQHPQLLQDLQDAGKRDDRFRKKYLGHYDVLLSDIDEVKRELESTLLEEPYDWYYSSKLEKVLEEKAAYIYNGAGYEMAMQVIDEMDEADVKKYLKRLIETNMTVGIEIIREQR